MELTRELKFINVQDRTVFHRDPNAWALADSGSQHQQISTIPSPFAAVQGAAPCGRLCRRFAAGPVRNWWTSPHCGR